MFLDDTYEKFNEKISQKHKISLRVPESLWKKIQEKALTEYEGRGKQSQLVVDAIWHFLKNARLDSIDWSCPDEDYDFIELATQIRMGASMKNLSPNPVQTHITDELYEALIDIESKIKGARKMLDVHIKPAIIRRALSQWMYADKKFLSTAKGIC